MSIRELKATWEEIFGVVQIYEVETSERSLLIMLSEEENFLINRNYVQNNWNKVITAAIAKVIVKTIEYLEQ